MIARRLARLRELLAQKDLPALLVSQPQNRRYLSGFTGSAGFLLISSTRAILATDFRYVEQATVQSPEFTVFRLRDGLARHLPELAAELDVTRLGFEAASLTVLEHDELAAVAGGIGLTLEPTVGLVERLRAVKDEEELRLLKRAVAVADEAFDAVAARLRPSMAERQVAWELEKYMREHGAEGVAFDIIVASGPRSALPHARPTDRPLGTSEPVVIDMGARVEGYDSDLTRTLVLGAPDETFRRVYTVVQRAQEAALAGIRPGMTGREADALARRVIEEAGYGEAFGHSLGHGIGLVEHELPSLRRTSEEVLVEGMVFSVEPGVYLPGWGGVRIEDLVVLEKEGVRVLSRAHKIQDFGRTI